MGNHSYTHHREGCEINKEKLKLAIDFNRISNSDNDRMPAMDSPEMVQMLESLGEFLDGWKIQGYWYPEFKSFLCMLANSMDGLTKSKWDNYLLMEEEQGFLFYIQFYLDKGVPVVRTEEQIMGGANPTPIEKEKLFKDKINDDTVELVSEYTRDEDITRDKRGIKRIYEIAKQVYLDDGEGGAKEFHIGRIEKGFNKFNILGVVDSTDNVKVCIEKSPGWCWSEWGLDKPYVDGMIPKSWLKQDYYNG